MNVPFVDLKSQYNKIKAEIWVEINEVLDNTAYICGKKAKKLEQNFAKLHNVKYSVALSSGTDALHVALHSLGIGYGDEVIVPVNTFIATSESVTLCGAKPVFVDHNEKTYNIDVSKIEAAITPKTKAILPVHLYGQPAEMDSILEIAKKHGLFVIEDCSQAHLAEYKNIKIGSIGNVGTFSFYPGKNLGAYGEAGAVTTNDEELHKKMLLFRQHGSIEKYVHDIEGHNYRIEEIQAGVLNVKMKYIEVWTRGRQDAAKLYSKTFADMQIDEITTPYNPDYINPVYHLYVIRAKDREGLMKYLVEHGVQTGLHYPVPLHMQIAYSYMGHKKGDFPVAENCCNEILSLPMFPEISDGQIQYVCQTVKEYYQK